MTARLAKVLRVPAANLDPRRGLLTFGLDSLAAVDLLTMLEERFGVELSPEDLLESKASIADVVTQVLGRLPRTAEETAAAAAAVAAGDRFEPFPLTDIQQAYLIGRSQAVELGGVGCQLSCEIDALDLDLERLERGLGKLIEHHDVLRAVMPGWNFTEHCLALPDVAQRQLRGFSDDAQWIGQRRAV